MEEIIYRNKNYKHIKTLKKPTKGSWVYVENPDAKEVADITKKYMLEESLITDALDPNEMPRIEIEEETIYLFTRIALTKGSKVNTFPVLIVVSPDYVVTVSREKLPFVDKIVKNDNIYTTHKTGLLIQILLEINNVYKTHLNNISKHVMNLSNKLEDITNRELVQFVENERVLNEFLSSLIPTSLIFQRVLHGKILRLYEEDEDLIEDLALSNQQLIETSKANTKYIVNIRESYTTIMTNNLNRTMKLLTSITVLLTIPTIIASFYGMNVALPGQNSPFAVFTIIAVTVGVIFVLLMLFIKNKLL